MLFAFIKDKGVSERTKTSIWKNWATAIQRLGLQNLAVTMLEAAGPVNVVGAQLVYLSQPVLDSIVAKDQLSALAEMLEEPKQTQAFIDFLQEQDLQE